MNLLLDGAVYHSATAAGQQWLPVYVRAQFEDALKIVREVWSDAPGWDDLTETLTVILHPAAFVDPQGRLDDGLTWPSMSEPKVECAWDAEFDQGRAVLRHEFCKMLAHYNSLLWGEFGDGISNDPYISNLKRKLANVYHGDVRLRHIRDLSVDL